MDFFRTYLIAKLGGTYPAALLFRTDPFLVTVAMRTIYGPDVVGTAIVGTTEARG